jgi:hypothetical protein
MDKELNVGAENEKYSEQLISIRVLGMVMKISRFILSL